MNEDESKYIAFLDVCIEQLDDMHTEAVLSENNDEVVAEMMALQMLLSDRRRQYESN